MFSSTLRGSIFGASSVAILVAVYFSGIVPKDKIWLSQEAVSAAFVCDPNHYTTEIVSTDPLVIYINNFTTAIENSGLIGLGAPDLAISEVYLNGRKSPSAARTSKSAGLSPASPIVQCVLSRARSFLGILLSPTEDLGTPQLVHYQAGEKFDLHHDWYDHPQPVPGTRNRFVNRIASFFVFLEDGCEGGETWFPYIEGKGVEEIGGGKWRQHEDGGVAFRPTSGNALFWVNLHANGTGDERVMHAGLPLKSGVKTAMNIWPRRYY